MPVYRFTFDAKGTSNRGSQPASATLVVEDASWDHARKFLIKDLGLSPKLWRSVDVPVESDAPVQQG